MINLKKKIMVKNKKLRCKIIKIQLILILIKMYKNIVIRYV